MRLIMMLTIRQRLWLLIASIMVLLLINWIVIYWSSGEVNKNVDKLYQNRMISIDRLIEADRDGYQSNISIAQALNSTNKTKPEETKKLIGFCKENIDQLNTRYNTFMELFKASESKVDASIDNTFRTNYNTFTTLSFQIIDLIQSGSYDQAESIYYSDYTKAFETMREAMNQYTDILLKEADYDYKQAIAHGQNMRIVNVFFFLLIILVTLGIALLISKSIRTQLNKAIDIAENISNGNLNVNVTALGKDETS
ncbi:MAG TPA: MCP four helix bundle domain-containing protein, partial [Bacteroidales bacterium]